MMQRKELYDLQKSRKKRAFKKLVTMFDVLCVVVMYTFVLLKSNSDSFSNLKIINITYLMEESVPGKVDEKATQLHAIASLKVLLDATKPQRGAATSSAANHVKINLKETTLGRPNGNIDAARNF
jgi:hypothetical protein